MKKSVFLMILITVLAWGATLWLDPPAPNMRSLMHEVYYPVSYTHLTLPTIA